MQAISRSADYGIPFSSSSDAKNFFIAYKIVLFPKSNETL